MTYFDNAATTYPKPECVRQAMLSALIRYGGNPGRGGHALSMGAAEELWRCREAAASFFGLPHPQNVIFTLNCTAALNMALKGLLRYGGRALISDMEHNAVMRPLAGASHVAYDVAPIVVGDEDATVAAFEKRITRATRVIVCNHCSNVFGVAAPVRRLGALARRYGIPFVVDAAQSAGILPINMEKDGIDFLCVAGHKGLYGPMGTGMLLCSGRYTLPPFIEGGTGSQSLRLEQPEDLPERLESGTPNVAGICGLHAGITWVRSHDPAVLAAQEREQLRHVYRCLTAHPRARLYTPAPAEGTAPVLSFTVEGQSPEQTAELLGAHGIAVRAGLHCAPAAHRKFGTLPSGTVRLSPSAFTTERETQALCRVLQRL